MPRPITFVVYDQASPRTSKENRRKIASHIGKHYRNRSAPARTLIAPNTKRLKPMVDPTSCSLVPVILGTPEETENSPKPHEIKHTSRVSAMATIQRNMYTIYPSPQQWTQFPYPERHHTSAKVAFDLEVNYVLPRHSNWGPGPNEYVNCLVQMMCRNGELFDAIAASAYGVYACNEHRSSIKPTSAGLTHRARALQGMQRKLISPLETISNETMLAVFYLLENAARFRHLRDFRTHYSGLRRMMELRGRITPRSLEETYVNQAIVILECSEIAWETRVLIERPPPINLTYTAGEFENNLPVRFKSLPVGFQSLAVEGSLSVEVLSLLAEVPPADYIKHDLGASERQLEVVQRARLLLRASKVAVERLVCLGAIAYSLRVIIMKHFFSEPSFWKRLAASGRIVSEDKYSRLHQELKVWVTVIAADLASSTCQELARKAVMRLKDQEEWVNSWEEVSHSMQKFFYSQSFAPTWQKYLECTILE
ncbi:hypothetical protein LTR84_001652 [Exophiala bonariae]|uniref:Uncharacterized protein n=1 Tax=Exophiala bonariae TaxID=1690606 RepID=A0AAV9NDM9_9EURO|nr:hypothetical protein LTR84_001652 [Exophiala bonariae]